jgi:hypothetical protein
MNSKKICMDSSANAVVDSSSDDDEFLDAASADYDSDMFSFSKSSIVDYLGPML